MNKKGLYSAVFSAILFGMSPVACKAIVGQMPSSLLAGLLYTGFDKIKRNYREAVSGLPVKRTIGILICLAAWQMPMALFYVFGFVVDWIKRGVRVIQK